MTRRTAKTFESGEVVEIKPVRRPWTRMIYRESFSDGCHVVEEYQHPNRRHIVPSRRIRKRSK